MNCEASLCEGFFTFHLLLLGQTKLLLHIPLLSFSGGPFIHFLYRSLSCAIFFTVLNCIHLSLAVSPVYCSHFPSYSPVRIIHLKAQIRMRAVKLYRKKTERLSYLPLLSCHRKSYGNGKLICLVYFSLDTNVRSETLPKKDREAFLSAFAELPQ